MVVLVNIVASCLTGLFSYSFVIRNVIHILEYEDSISKSLE